jgi:cytochrome b561
MATPTRYNSWLVTLNWSIFLLVVALAGLGIYLDNSASAAQKPALLGIHMAVGLLTLILMVVRVFVRSVTPKPAPATTGSGFLDRVGKLTHILLYIFVIAANVTGVVAALQANVFPAVYEGVGMIPKDFSRVTTYAGHVISLPFLIILILLHVGAALYHQFILKDGLMARMWYGLGRNAVKQK